MTRLCIICLLLAIGLFACREKEKLCAYANPIIFFVGYDRSEVDTMILYACEKGNYDNVLDSTIHTVVSNFGVDTIWAPYPDFTIGDFRNNSWMMKVTFNNRIYKFDITSSSLNSATERDRRNCASYMRTYTLDGVTNGPLFSGESGQVYLVK